jgi:hypothetical protein
LQAIEVLTSSLKNKMLIEEPLVLAPQVPPSDPPTNDGLAADKRMKDLPKRKPGSETDENNVPNLDTGTRYKTAGISTQNAGARYPFPTEKPSGATQDC